MKGLSLRSPETPHPAAFSGEVPSLDTRTGVHESPDPARRVLPEHEARFIIPVSSLPFDLSRCRREYHVQDYFPESQLALVSAFARGIADAEDLPEDFSLTQARLRAVAHGERTEYSLVVKGKEYAITEDETVRRELPLQLSEKFYGLLLPHAADGHLEKTRYEVRGGRIYTDEGDVRVNVTLDILERAGKLGSHRVPAAARAFAITEVEVPTAELLGSVRIGSHSMTYLNAGVDIKDLDRAARKALSYKRLAREGVDAKALKAFAEIEELLD